MICKYCNEPFDELKPWQLFCCQRCQQDWHLQQKRRQTIERRKANASLAVALAMDGSLAEKVREAMANIPINISANATRPKHKCQGCGRMTTNERFCSPGCRMKLFDKYENAQPMKLVRRI